MLHVLIYNIFAMFGGRVYQQAVYSPMHINCASLLTDFLLYSYKADFLQGLLKKNEKKLARPFNSMFRYTYDVLLLNNSRIGDFVVGIYIVELEVKDITDTATVM